MSWTYTTLTAAAKDYLETDETTFNSYIDTAIHLTEEDILLKVPLPNFRTAATASATASSPYLQTPLDFLSPFSLAVVQSNSHSFLLRKEVSFIREAYASSTTTGVPAYYALMDDDTFILGPTPGSAYSMELHYYYEPESIISAGTSWLGDNAENAMLWGVVLHMYVFLKGSPDLIGTYKAAYDEAVEQLKVLANVWESRDEYRNSKPRVEV